ncbi:DUF177 domain-containing protein [Chloroflexota bacterium]
MVQINVSQQLQEPIGSLRSYGVNEVMNIAGGNSSVQGQIRLMRTDRGILTRGGLHTEIGLICSRCLKFFHYPLTLGIEEEYFPITEVTTGASIPLPDEPGCFSIDENNILDLSDAIRQYALLAFPMKPLCSEDCTGLCSTCGCNLNQGHCNCSSESVDARLSKLNKLVLADSQILVNE